MPTVIVASHAFLFHTRSCDMANKTTRNAPTPTKADLRKIALSTRHLSPECDAQICAQFLKIYPPNKNEILAFYWPLKGEPDPRPIARAYHETGALCALPCIRTDGTHGLIFKIWDPTTPLVKSSFGTLEPQNTTILSPTLMLIPMLMADKNGNRLGRGAGYYDATLQSARPHTAIGLIYDHQLCSGTLPHEPHDQILDTLITPTQILRFGDC